MTTPRFRNILVAIDFSACSDAALSYGRILARTFGATLHVLHVVEAAAARDWLGAGHIAAALPELKTSLEDGRRARLEALITADDRKALGAVSILRSFEPAGEAITDQARSNQIDLIVIGTHGRQGLSHLVMGSVAEHVVRSAPCPVLVVRAPDAEPDSSDDSDTPSTQAT